MPNPEFQTPRREPIAMCRRCGFPIRRKQRRVGGEPFGPAAHLGCGDAERREAGLAARVVLAQDLRERHTV